MPIKFNAICPKKIIIEKDVWIASGVRILEVISLEKEILLELVQF